NTTFQYADKAINAEASTSYVVNAVNINAKACIFDKNVVDKSVVDESAVDKGVVDESAVNEGVVDKSAVDKNAVDNKTNSFCKNEIAKEANDISINNMKEILPYLECQDAAHQLFIATKQEI
ncbi:16344_t:CDS:2, partial [Racocetra fulgida]